MTVDSEDLRLAIYTSLASTGRAPETAALAATLGAHQDEIEAGLRQLAAARHLALGTDGRVALAHPFSTVDLGFSVKGAHTLWWGGCVWDVRRDPAAAREYLRSVGLSGAFWGL